MAGAASTTTFWLWRAWQDVSPLLQLPAELRIKILRSLLKKPKPIYARSSSSSSAKDGSDEFNQPHDLELSSQLLRTCQQLYEEGRHVLYNENVLCVEYRPDTVDWLTGSTGTDICCVLGQHLNLPYRPFGLPCRISSFFEYARERDKVSERPSPVWHTMKLPNYSLAQIYPALVAFRHITLEVRNPSKNRVFIACRVLHDLLVGKHVTMAFLETRSSRRSSEPTERDMGYVTGCGLLRCRSLRIRRPTKLERRTETRLVETENLVTGPTMSDDTYQQWLDLEEYLVYGVPEINGRKFCDDERVIWSIETVREAAVRYDSVKYEQHEREIMGVAGQWIEEFREWRKAEAETKRQMEERLADHLRSKTKKARSTRENKEHLVDQMLTSDFAASTLLSLQAQNTFGWWDNLVKISEDLGQGM